jgi:hypothetical protein
MKYLLLVKRRYAIEHDLCGSVYGGPGLNKAIVAAGQVNVCVNCLRKSRGNGEPLPRVGRRGPRVFLPDYA